MNTLQIIENYLDSREVAEMVEKSHSELLKDIRRYIGQFNAGKIPFVDFFRESVYQDKKGEIRPCYEVTKKGCEFIAHKLTGTKGTIFTARYINRFHEMEDIITQQNHPKLPWFIKRFRDRYIVLERDFVSVTGVDITKHKLFYRPEHFIGGRDFNGWGWKCDNEEFKAKYGFDYGDDDCMMYLYPCGVRKALRILGDDRKIAMNPGSKEMLLNGIVAIEKPKKPAIAEQRKSVTKLGQNPVQITIVLKQNEIETAVC